MHRTADVRDPSRTTETRPDRLVRDPALWPVAEKVIAGTSLSHADGLTLFATPDVHGVGRLANLVRECINGDAAYYNRNRHINYSNVCALSCKFCSFYRKRGEEGAYEMPVEQVVAAAKKAWDGGATEVHIVGGLHPWLKFDYYLDFLRGIRATCPGLHVKAFTAIEIVHFSRIARMGIPEVLAALKEAGLGSLPGGGAEIFDDRVHDEAFKGKVRADKWFEVHRAAHAQGLFTNATMLYGHIEGVAERVTHLIKLREHQAESLDAAGIKGSRDQGIKGQPGQPSSIPRSLDPSIPSRAFFNCIIPLSFIPEDSELGHLPGPTGLNDLRTLAVTRLMVDNVAHIKAFWIMQSVHLSQVALDYGCDDLDGTVVWYDITKRQGDAQHQELHVETIKRLVREARRTPVERDTLYRVIERDENDKVIAPKDLVRPESPPTAVEPRSGKQSPARESALAG
ncbi:MAG: radical SAM protein [Phycisphaerae bacterium]